MSDIAPAELHTDILRRFKRLLENDTLAHAYLFTGAAEIGKYECALALAKLINCEKNTETFCDECASCRKIKAGNHPDVMVIQREEEATLIKVEQVRNLLAQAKYKPFEAKRKIFIIKNIEELNAEGANTLLKTLEEPTSSSLLILTTAVEDNILPTVRSRCQFIPFLPLSAERIIQQLEGEYVESFNSSHFLAYFAEGCLNKAKRLREEEFFKTKNDYLDEFLHDPDNEEFIKKITSDKEQTLIFLKLMLSWIRDGMLLKAGVKDVRLIHLDRKKDLEDFQARFSFDELNAIYRQSVLTIRQAMDNLNAKMALTILGEMIHG